MKRIYKIMFLILLAGAIPISSAFGQEKKNERKIKIVIADESGTKTVIDTIFTGDSTPETIRLKNGKVIIFDKPGGEKLLEELPEGKGEFFVTITTDEGGEKQEKKIIIMSSDSVKWTGTAKGEKGSVYAYCTTRSAEGKPGSKVIIASTGGKNIDFEGDKVIIVKDKKFIKKEGGQVFDIYVETDENDSDADITRYVVAKDGLVVTVEGKDETKAKELIEMIESKLNVKGETIGDKEAVKTETKKTGKNK